MSKNKKYDESSIDVLKGLDPVRQRPGMYTDTTNPNHMLQEVVDNAQDEALAGHATTIEVEWHEDGSVSVEDNGRGIPVGIHPGEKKPVVEVVFTALHAGGKFKKGEGQSYGFTGGLHGVGVSVTNALSDRLEVTVYRDGYEHSLAFAHGNVIEPLSKKKLPKDQSERTGTRVRAWPTAKYFDHPQLNAQHFERYLRSKAVLLKGAQVTWKRPDRPPTVWSFPDGISQYLQEQMQGEAEWVAPIFTTEQFYESSTENFEKGEGFELAVGWGFEGRTVRESYVNLIMTTAGGRHETGLRSGLLDAFRNIGERTGAFPKGIRLENEDIQSSMSFVLSVKLLDPQFQNQTKDKMTSEKGQRLVSGLLRDAMELWLTDNPQHAKNLLDVMVQSAIRRTKSGQKTERKRQTGASVLPGKLADCESKDVSSTELFLVEGDSAGGCFVGSTLVALANGKNISFKDMVQEQKRGVKHYGYTVKDDGQIEVAELKHARVTKKNASLVRITLDNGISEICTPDHLWMLRDGTYCKAESLVCGEALMPLYRRMSKTNGLRSREGYEQVMNPASGKWRFTHILADGFNVKNGVYPHENGVWHRHHIDFDKHNNYPTNIVRMTPASHMDLHAKHASVFLHSAEAKEKSRQVKQTKAFRENMSTRMMEPQTRQVLSEQAKKQWENPEYKQFMIDSWKTYYNNNLEYRLSNNEILKKCAQDYWSKEENRVSQSARVTRYYQSHPEAKESMSAIAKQQWEDAELLAWRAAQTSAQWTDEFRASRKKAMDKHYYNRTMSVMKKMHDENGCVDQKIYDTYRLACQDRYVMKMNKFVNKFFGGSYSNFVEAVECFNHKVVSVDRLQYTEDVYDLEVEETHNYALASGVFVHNSSKQGRDRVFQAILPLRGKLLNTWDVDAYKALTSETISDIAAAIGVDPHTYENMDKVDLSKLRYGKIFIMADADVDGSHIQVLLQTLFLRHFPILIVKGHIWVAQAPLYRIDAPAKKGSKGGPRKMYALDEQELIQAKKSLEKEGVREESVSVTRFKGLGEMNAVQLGETTMNPEVRRAIRISIEDFPAAAAAFDKMMGSKNAKQRREWMEAEGHAVDLE